MTGPIVVTGATGFVGPHLLARLAGATDAALIGWSRTAGHQPPQTAPANVTWMPVDLLDGPAVDDAIARARPGTIVHLAGASHVGTSWTSSVEPLAIHVRGTHHLLEAVRRHAPRCRVVVASSGTVYRASDTPLDERAPLGPNNPYAVSKLAEEELARHAARVDGLDIVVARPFNHIGPGQSAQFAVAEFARQIVAIERGAPPVITIGNLDARRDFTDVRDVVNAYALLAELPVTTTGAEDRTFNICSGHARSMREILDRLLALARVEVTVQQDASRLRPNDTPVFVGDFGRVAAATGWSPVIPLDTTLADVLADWRARTPSA